MDNSSSSRVFRLAVTGHRAERINPGVEALLAVAVDTFFSYVEQEIDAIREVANNSRNKPAELALVVVSALAEGADRIVARVGLRRGWKLQAVLPFARNEYEQDFATSESRREFYALLSAAHTVSELTRPRDANAVAGYVAVGKELVNNADLLVAIWDGEPARGPGGTAHVVDDALQHKVPVVWMVPETEISICMIKPTVPGQEISKNEERWSRELTAHLRGVIS